MNALQRTALQAPEQSDTFLQFASQWTVALDAGLSAAAEVYQEAVKARLARGYTSGAYVGERRFGLPTVANSVRVRRPKFDRNGVRYVAVGSNNVITRWWEFGHYNVKSRRFLRVEHWREAMWDASAPMAQAFHDVFDAALDGGPTVIEAAA